MKKHLLFALLLSATIAGSCLAKIHRVANGGVDINISDIVPEQEPCVLVFHTLWDQKSVSLVAEMEEWAKNHPDLIIVFIDVVDERTQVYRQFALVKIPSIVVFNRDRHMIGAMYDELSELENLLREHDLL